jgi:hypothetical protein
MKRSLVQVSAVILPLAGLSAPATRASDVHFGVSLAIPFEHGAVGIAFGNAPVYGGYGPYYGPHHGHGHHGYHYGPPMYDGCGPWLPYSSVSIAIPVQLVAPAPVAVASAPAPAPEPATEPAYAAPPPAPAPAVFLPKSTDMSGCLQLRLHGKTYFFDGGTFFRKTSSGYVSTAAPVGAIAQHLPGDAEAMMLGGQEYFQSGDTVFKQVRDGFMLLDG